MDVCEWMQEGERAIIFVVCVPVHMWKNKRAENHDVCTFICLCVCVWIYADLLGLKINVAKCAVIKFIELLFYFIGFSVFCGKMTYSPYTYTCVVILSQIRV